MTKSNYDLLVEHFIETDELGHYDETNWSIMLYDFPIKEIDLLRERIKVFTPKFKLAFSYETGEKYTNVNILDIDL